MPLRVKTNYILHPRCNYNIYQSHLDQLIIRVYGDDGSSKTMFADETMTCRQVVHILVEKNHLDERADWAVVEQIPDLYMGKDQRSS